MAAAAQEHCGYVSKLRKMAEVINVSKEAFAVDPFVRNADGTIENAAIRVNGKKVQFPRLQVPITLENGKTLFLLLSFDNTITRDDGVQMENEQVDQLFHLNEILTLEASF